MERVNHLLIQYTGWDRSAAPTESWTPVGDEPSTDERRRVNEVMSAVKALEPDWSSAGLDDDLGAGAAWARERMSEQFSWLSSESLEALAWTFAFAWR